MQDSNGDIVSRAAIGLAVGTIAAFSLYIWSTAAWSAASTSVALQALIAFLTIVAASWMYIYFSRTRLLSHAILLSFLIALSVIHIGGAIPLLYLQFPIITKTAPDKVSDILEVTMIGIALVVASIKQHSIPENRTSSWIIPLVVTLVLASYGGIYFFVLVPITETMLMLLSFAIGIGTILLLLYCSFFYSRIPLSFRTNDAALFLVCIGLFLLSIVPLLLSMIYPTLVWALSLTLQAFGMLLFMLAISIPSQREMNMSDSAAIRFPVASSLLAFVPFLVSILAQVAIPALLIVDIPAYALSHIGAAALSGVMTFLIYAHHRRKPRKIHFPLVLVFASWTVIETYILLTLNYDALQIYGESLVPYIIGTLVSCIGLLRAANWANRFTEKSKDGILRWIAWRFVVVIAVIILGTYVEGILISEAPGLQGSPLGRSLLLSSNLAVMFIIIHLTYKVAKNQGSWKSLEGYSIGFLSLWIAPHILKGIYLDFQFGWWAGEFILLAGLLLGPVALGTLYLQELRITNISQRRATLFSDILVHDISNLHQAIVVSLGLLDVEDAEENVHASALEDARASLQRAHQLIRNVRHLGQLDQEGGIPQEPVDLVESIRRAIKQVEIENPETDLGIVFDGAKGKRYVLADNLLNDLWYNILRNSVMYSPREKSIKIEINEILQDGKSFWETRITDHGQGIPKEMKAELFRRFMAGAKGTGLGLSVVYALTMAYGGKVAVSDRVPGDHSLGTVFSILLPTANYAIIDTT